MPSGRPSTVSSVVSGQWLCFRLPRRGPARLPFPLHWHRLPSSLFPLPSSLLARSSLVSPDGAAPLRLAVLPARLRGPARLPIPPSLAPPSLVALSCVARSSVQA